jgi:tetratricopeptide repeat protein 21B
MDYGDNSKTNAYENLSLQQSQSYVYYYLHDHHFTTLLPVCQFFYNRYNDPFFVFWRAFAIFKSGMPSQAVNELQKISSMTEIQWATTKASILYHRKCDPVDNRTVDQLEVMEPDFERNARERDVVAGCYFLMFLSKEEGGDVEWASDILKRSRFDGPQIEVCRGWCQILLEEGSLVSFEF